MDARAGTEPLDPRTVVGQLLNKAARAGNADDALKYCQAAQCAADAFRGVRLYPDRTPPPPDDRGAAARKER